MTPPSDSAIAPAGNFAQQRALKEKHRPFSVNRAHALGMCFGVRDAIALAHASAAQAPLTVLGDLVHNETVLEDLRAGGIQFAHHPDHVATSTVMITAHGASERKLTEVRQRGLNVLEATCPLVHFAHNAVKKLVAEGFHPVIIGQAGHVEVRGLTEDLSAFDVILSEADVNSLHPRPKFGVAAQTTQPIQKVRALTSLIRRRFPQSDVRFADTVCQPTKQRQSAAVDLARTSDVVIVIGGAHSNNTRELVNTCRAHCPRVHHIQGPCDLQPEWLLGADTVGLTAGTSTPDTLIDQVEEELRLLAVGP